MTDDILELFGYPAPRLLGPMLPVGSVTTLAGSEFDGVSTLAAAIAVSVASGEEIVPGWQPAWLAQKVVWFDYVSNRDEWSTVIDRICDGAKVERPSIIYTSLEAPFYAELARIEAPDIADPELAARVAAREAWGATPSPGLRVIDGAARAAGPGGGEALLRLYGALRGLTSLVVGDVTALSDGKAWGSAYGPVWWLRRPLEQPLLLSPTAGGEVQSLRVAHADDVIRFDRP